MTSCRSRRFPRPNKAVHHTKAYETSDQRVFHLHSPSEILKLDSNESFIGISKEVRKALIRSIQNSRLHWYPEIQALKLREALAQYTNVPSSWIHVFNGSDHALEVLFRTYLSPRREVLMLGPTYDNARAFAESQGSRVSMILGQSLQEPLLEKISQKVTPRTKVIYIANPNNPTGTLYHPEELTRWIARYPNILFIIDEAYYEFCGVTLSFSIAKFRNLTIVRTFSKAFGLAGLRCGYVLAQPSVLSSLEKIRGGKSVNTLVQVAALAALEDVSSMHRYVDEVTKAKRWLIEQLKSKGLAVVESPANFILIKVAQPHAVETYLHNFNIFIRNRSHLSLMEGMIRVTIGTTKAMEDFWKNFSHIPDRYLFSEEHLAEHPATAIYAPSH